MNNRPTIAARLDRLPVTRTHVIVTAIVGIGFFFDIYDVLLAGVLGAVLTDYFKLDRMALPSVLGSSFLGMFFGAVFIGRAADKLGRRTTYLLNLAIYSAFTLLGAFSTNAPMLIASRFLAGVGLGSQLPLGDSYLAEVLPAKARGRFIAWAYTLGFLGVPASGVLARVLVPSRVLDVPGWRWLFVVGSLGALIVWALQRLLPESPRWLESVGRLEEAERITERWEREALRTHAVLAPVILRPPPVRQALNFAALFSPEYRNRTLMLFVFQIFQAVGYYGFGNIAPLVLATKGFSVTASLTYTTMAFVGYPVGSAASLLLVERIDRKWLIVGSASLMATFGVGLGYSSLPAAIVTLGFLYTVCSNVFSNAYHILQPEIFPTAFRATAAGTAYGLSRLSSAVAPFVLLPVLGRFGAGPMFALIAGGMLVVIVDIAWFAPRTTGRALEDINEAAAAGSGGA